LVFPILAAALFASPKAKGVGVLATVDAEGKVNTAIYSGPHFLDPSDDNATGALRAF
jgi:hypothetical protein